MQRYEEKFPKPVYVGFRRFVKIFFFRLFRKEMVNKWHINSVVCVKWHVSRYSSLTLKKYVGKFYSYYGFGTKMREFIVLLEFSSVRCEKNNVLRNHYFPYFLCGVIKTRIKAFLLTFFRRYSYIHDTVLKRHHYAREFLERYDGGNVFARCSLYVFHG